MALIKGDLQFHLKVTPDQVGKYAILPGALERVPEIAKYLDNAEQTACNREYNIYTGTLLGEKVSVVSTGIGGPSTAIAVEELVRCGVHTFIRIGTCGGMNLKVSGGDIVIGSAAIRGDGTSREYMPEGYPSVADYEVLDALVTAAKKLSAKEEGNNFHVGVVQSKDSFYGQVSPDTMPMSDYLDKRWEAYVKLGCLASEMEAATLFAVAQTRNVRAGAVFHAIWNLERCKAGIPDNESHDTDRAIRCSVEAIKLLIERDRND